jgi:hypothetical protein
MDQEKSGNSGNNTHSKHDVTNDATLILNVTAFQPLWTKELPSLEVFIMAICIIK